MRSPHVLRATPGLAPETLEAWARRSLTLSLVGLAYLFVTGLGILLLPFSTGTQVVVLGHTLGGVLLLAPLSAFLARHLARHGAAKVSHLMLLGWASGLLTVVAVATGVVLTVQALWGRSIDPGWDLWHTVAGCASLPILAAHLVTAIRKRPGERRFASGRLLGTLLLGSLLSVACWGGGEALLERPVRRTGLPEGYGTRYGDNPFAPSLARTDLQARVDAERRWAAFLGECVEHVETATDERLDGFLAKAERAHQDDLDAAARGDPHAQETGALERDGPRLRALGEALAEREPAARRERLAALRARVQQDLAQAEAAFRAAPGLAPEALAGSASCGTSGCHTEIVREWEPSAHRYASRSAFFQLIQKAMADVNGADSTRYCAGCHDPIALFSGAKNIYDHDLTSPGADEGLSCAACHAITRTDVEGNANYTLAPPERYLAEDGLLGRFLIRAYPRHHKATYGRPLLTTPELCAACHKQFIDKELNRATRVQLQNQYDSWKGSPWHAAEGSDPHGSGSARTLACRDCHMRQTGSEDPVASRKGGKHRHHGFVAANQWLPRLHDLPGADTHIALTEAWLKGETVLPEIADRWPAGPIVPLAIDAPASVRPGERVRLRVTLDNTKVGHTFPTGPLDMIQAWVDLRVTQGGREVFRSGALDERGFLEEGAFELKSEGVDRAGNLIDRHNLWDMVGARFRRAVHPGYADTETFTFECACESVAPVKPSRELHVAVPPAGEGDLEIVATLRYRKVNQALLNMLVPDGSARAPVTDMTQARAVVRVERSP